MANTLRLQELFDKYLLRRTTVEELKELGILLQEVDAEDKVSLQMQTVWNKIKEQNIVYPVDWESMYQAVIAGKQISVVPIYRKKINWYRWAAAASIILMLGLGSYLLFFNKPAKQGEIVKTQQERFKNDVNPGGYKARLTLVDGRTIVLDSATIGELTKQGSTVVLNKDGELIYDDSRLTTHDSQLLYNTLITARGETYASVLADGTRVWLNSASSVRFPVSFVGSERKIEITGEAYLEVARDLTRPFHVSVEGMDVEVLGTHFNINSYEDEPTLKTTLLEGSVKVTRDGMITMLKPREQLLVTNTGESKVLKEVNMDEVIAWKENRFEFSNAPVEAVMRELARWYDITPVYDGKLNEGFNGRISRNEPISKVLKLLELTEQVRFKIEGKTVTVASP